jgi:hypothetical protein
VAHTVDGFVKAAVLCASHAMYDDELGGQRSAYGITHGGRVVTVMFEQLQEDVSYHSMFLSLAALLLSALGDVPRCDLANADVIQQVVLFGQPLQLFSKACTCNWAQPDNVVTQHVCISTNLTSTCLICQQGSNSGMW